MRDVITVALFCGFCDCVDALWLQVRPVDAHGICRPLRVGSPRSARHDFASKPLPTVEHSKTYVCPFLGPEARVYDANIVTPPMAPARVGMKWQKRRRGLRKLGPKMVIIFKLRLSMTFLVAIEV